MIGNKYITNRFATDYVHSLQKYIYWVDQPLRSMAPLRLTIYEINQPNIFPLSVR